MLKHHVGGSDLMQEVFFFLAGYGVRMMGHTTSKLAGGHYLKKLQKDENLGMLAASFSVPIQWMRMRWWSFFFFSYNSLTKSHALHLWIVCFYCALH
jgi:hypothetical protein